jgi:hypothetical protein
VGERGLGASESDGEKEGVSGGGSAREEAADNSLAIFSQPSRASVANGGFADSDSSA